MPSTAATPRPPPQTTNNFRDGGVRTGAGQSIGESSRCIKVFFLLLFWGFLQCEIHKRLHKIILKKKLWLAL